MRANRLLILFLGGALWASAQLPDFTPPTPLFGAVLRNDIEAVKKLLDSGANPNEGRFIGGGSALFLALAQRNLPMAEALIAKGADVKATDGAGSTTLMWAAYDDSGDPRLVDRLIRMGVDVNAANKRGETALQWAKRRGYTKIVAALQHAGANDSDLTRQAVEKAVALLQKSGPEFIKVSGCASCHNNSLPQMAFSAARARGWAVDEANASYQVKAVIGMYRPATEVMATGKANLPDPAITVSYALAGLAAEKYPPDATTAAMAHLISLMQTPDGSFAAFPARPPIESSVFTATALSVRGLQAYGKDAGPQIEKARAWLMRAAPSSGEDRAMRVLGLTWAGAPEDAVRKAAQELLAEQHSDGGWTQLSTLHSDAYATGQAMVALKLAGQIETGDPAWQRAASYLLRTQLEDGSWLVQSRSFPFQPYKESGFPHGKNQWISAAGTSWAAWALSLGEPVRRGPAIQSAAAVLK